MPLNITVESLRIAPLIPAHPVTLQRLTKAALIDAGIIQLPAFALRDDLLRGTLVRVLPQAPMATTSIHALHAFGRQVPMRVRLFIEYLLETRQRFI